VHDVVNKTEAYVRGQVHVNGMENFWSLLKRGLKGSYVAVEPFHLERYVDEQILRFTIAHKRQSAEWLRSLSTRASQVANKRLTFKELTGKTPDARQGMPKTF
jgi:ISXO2-like transposase domain